MYLTGPNSPQAMGRIPPPWAARVPKAPLDARALGTFLYWTNVLHVGIERGREHLAGDALAILMTLEEGWRKSGIYGGHIEGAAKSLGIPIDWALYQSEKEAYIYALVQGDIGDWNPIEQKYPGFVQLRDFFYRRRPQPQLAGVPRVHAPTMANEGRLSVGEVLPGYRARDSRTIRTSNMPQPSRNTLGYRDAGFHNQWWQRKEIGEFPMPPHRAGNLLQWP